MMAVLDTLRQLLGGASAAFANLERAVDGFRERLDKGEQEEQQLLSRPGPPSDVKRNHGELVLDLGRRGIERVGMYIVHAHSGRIERDVGPVDQRDPDRLVPATLADVLVAGPVTFELLAMLLPDLLIAGLDRVVDATHYESGPPLAARLKRLAAIEAERAELQREHAQLVDEAAASGVTLAYLPEEVGRRAAVARKKEFDDRQAADMKRRGR